uniref:C2 domain-containing protein n=1 Tax=Kalanchoe fedtschenkoi TaxID=63787 RepID=A0A7N0T446_KALFE
MSSSKILEVTLISCEGLTISRKKSLKRNARGVIRVPPSMEVFSTNLDKEGGAHPRWNEKFTMEMPPRAAGFDVEVCDGFGKVIGAARVPATDFSSGVLPDGHLNFLSYRLRERSGKFNGVVNVSVRVVKRKEEEGNGFGCGYVVGVPSRVVTGFPVFSGTN